MKNEPLDKKTVRFSSQNPFYTAFFEKQKEYTHCLSHPKFLKEPSRLKKQIRVVSSFFNSFFHYIVDTDDEVGLDNFQIIQDKLLNMETESIKELIELRKFSNKEGLKKYILQLNKHFEFLLKVTKRISLKLYEKGLSPTHTKISFAYVNYQEFYKNLSDDVMDIMSFLGNSDLLNLIKSKRQIDVFFNFYNPYINLQEQEDIFFEQKVQDEIIYSDDFMAVTFKRIKTLELTKIDTEKEIELKKKLKKSILVCFSKINESLSSRNLIPKVKKKIKYDVTGI